MPFDTQNLKPLSISLECPSPFILFILARRCPGDALSICCFRFGLFFRSLEYFQNAPRYVGALSGNERVDLKIRSYHAVECKLI